MAAFRNAAFSCWCQVHLTTFKTHFCPRALPIMPFLRPPVTVSTVPKVRMSGQIRLGSTGPGTGLVKKLAGEASLGLGLAK
jgi:hypothetical protein